MKKEYFIAYKGLSIPYLSFEEKNRTKNIVILHDAFDNINRYEELATFLFNSGYNVYVPEYRGHGELKEKEVSDFGEGLEAVIKDLQLFIHNKLANINYRDIIILGHGLGSLLSFYLAINEPFKYMILSALSFEKYLTIESRLFKTKLEKKCNIEESTLNNLRKSYDIKFKNEGDFAYLTSDKEELRKYLRDENCGFKANSQYFNDIYRLMKYVKSHINDIRDDANILVILGENDSSIFYEKTRKYLIKINNKVRKIKILKNDRGRHDNFHEINRKEIFEEILKWLNKTN